MVGVERWAVTQATTAVRVRRAAPPVRNRSRWSADRGATWATDTGWLMGCNFIPSSAGNQLEMWQADTFDPVTIDRELGWAAELGMNSIRLFLHDLAWATDGHAFLDRVEQVIEIAERHGISVMPVLFDGIWDPDPKVGRQREPRPGIHNSTWLQSPGALVVANPGLWADLRPYVDAVLRRFGNDSRIVMWDLFNEPDSPNPAYLRREPSHKPVLIGRLLERIWDWAVEANPTQPLTTGVFLYPSLHAANASPAARLSLERSEVITFHSYTGHDGLVQTIDGLSELGRPLVCTEWMARPTSPVALIDVFANRNVGAYSWGLVDGRSQTKYPWTSWIRRASSGAPWFHDLLHPDGRPYAETEAAALRNARRTAPR